MKRLIFLLLLLISTPLVASHIVGGEFELLHVNGFTYQLNLIYYFDVVQNPNRDIQSEEPRIWVYIYRKSDNMKMDSVNLEWLRKTRVGYTQPSCSQGEIITDKIIYTKNIELNASKYNDAGGYYVMWARCCRNYSILNIISQDPTQPGSTTAAGQTFYLEFPPVVKDGKAFINSSPKDFPALNDYACPTKPYYVDFSGVDVDGDSLVYTMMTPLSTISAAPVPGPSPQPYPDVTWLAPKFGFDRIVNGTPKTTTYPDLTITRAGLLRVTPRSLGLYVFAVKVEEFRDKIKIGESRRDFQMLVTDCRLSVAPQISGKKINGASFTRGEINVQFSNNVNDQDRCVVVSIKDDDSNRAADNFQEFISLKIVALNFKGELSSLLPATSSGFIGQNQTIEFNVCFMKCPFFLGGTAQIGIIAFDDACALPMSDTLRVNIDVEPPDNQPAEITPPKIINATLLEGETASWDFEAHDVDNDELLLFPLPSGFAMDKAGMKLDITENSPGVLKGTLSWDAFCDIYDFTKLTDFTLKILVDDVDECDLNDPDEMTFNLSVTLPPDSKPIVDTDLTPDVQEIEVDIGERKIFDKISFNVTGKDLVDNDRITVRMVGDGFSPTDYGMSFEKKSSTGSVSSLFNWDLLCDKFDLAQRDNFNIAFLAIDSIGKCRVRYLDSMVVKLKVIPPTNIRPQISMINLNDDIEFNGQTAVVWPGQQLDLQLNVTDNDLSPADLLSLQIIDSGGDEVPENWSFTNSTGASILSSVFSWAPLCTLFKDNVFEHDFYFDFRYSDDRCLTAVVDTIRVNVKVKDRESNNMLFDPVNVFTPNGDGINDFYSMERRNETGELVSILPFDNCQGVFQNVRIYNRWGRTVFSSNDRNFRWDGLNEAAGVYFFRVAFSNRDFKGTVSLRD